MSAPVPPEVQRLLANDESVLETLVRNLGPAIEAMLWERFPLLRPYAEDLLVESLYRLWVRRRDYDPSKGSLSTWWWTIAQNAARDLLRAGWQQARACEAAGTAWIEQAADTPVDEDGEDSQSTPSPAEQAFWEILAGLSEVDRRIILFHAQVDGAGHWAADLAGELGISAGAIRVRRLRIVERIRLEMQKRGFSPSPKEGAGIQDSSGEES